MIDKQTLDTTYLIKILKEKYPDKEIKVEPHPHPYTTLLVTIGDKVYNWCHQDEEGPVGPWSLENQYNWLLCLILNGGYDDNCLEFYYDGKFKDSEKTKA